MPDVRMPDGTIIRNVPEGTTKAQLMARLQKAKRPEKSGGILGAIGDFVSQGNEAAIGGLQFLENAASAVTDPIASLVAGKDTVKQVQNSRQKRWDSAADALTTRRSPTARTIGQIGMAAAVPVGKIGALGKIGNRALQGAIGGAGVRDSNQSAAPGAAIGAAANVVLPPLLSKLAQSKPAQAVGRAASRAMGGAPKQVPQGLAPLGRKAQARAARFKALGVDKPTTGMVTRDPAAFSFEQNTAKLTGVGDDLARQMKEAEATLVEKGRSVVRGLGGAKGPEATGKAVEEVLDAKRAEMQQVTGRLYDKVRETRGNEPVGDLAGLRALADDPDMADNATFDAMRDSLMRRLKRLTPADDAPALGNVFHGSPSKDLTRISASPNSRQYDNATSQLGAFFSPSKAGAQRYAGEGGRIYGANLKLAKPYEMPWKEFDYLQSPHKMADGSPATDWASRAEQLKGEAAALRQKLMEAGHDGIIVRGSRGQPVEIASFSDVPLPTHGVTVKQAEELRKFIGGLGSGIEPSVRMMRGKMIDALDDDVVNAVGDDAFKAARASARARFEEFGKTFPGKLADEKLAPELLTKRVLGDGVKLSDLRSLKRSLSTGTDEQVARGQAAWRDLQSQAVDDLLSKAVDADGNLVGTVLSREFGKAAPKLREILGPEEFKTIRRIAAATRDMKAYPVGHSVNTSNTAVTLANMFEKSSGAVKDGWLKTMGKMGLRAGAHAAAAPAGPLGNLAVEGVRGAAGGLAAARAEQQVAESLVKQIQMAQSPEAAAAAIQKAQQAAASSPAVADFLNKAGLGRLIGATAASQQPSPVGPR